MELGYLGLLDGLTPIDPMLDGWEPYAGDVLARWLVTVRGRPDAAVVAERVLEWVEERLGRSGAGLEQQAILLGGPGAPRPLDVRQCLRDDLLAVRVWLVAGLVAVTGSGGPGLPRPPGAGPTGDRPGRRPGDRHSADTPDARGEQHRRSGAPASAGTVGPER